MSFLAAKVHIHGHTHLMRGLLTAIGLINCLRHGVQWEEKEQCCATVEDGPNDLAAVFATPKKRLVATRPGSVQQLKNAQ